jgi:hypothetical protein
MTSLVIDYTDKLCDARFARMDRKADEATSVYEACRRDIADARRMWVWGATQVNRNVKGTRITMDDIADSSGKVRVADLVLSQIREAADAEATLYGGPPRVILGVIKDRHGPSVGRSLPPIETDWKHGRMTPWDLEMEDWAYVGL